jgi:hypothetical protein
MAASGVAAASERAFDARMASGALGVTRV